MGGLTKEATYENFECAKTLYRTIEEVRPEFKLRMKLIPSLKPFIMSSHCLLHAPGPIWTPKYFKKLLKEAQHSPVSESSS